jgi:hypothetical protein
MDEPDWRSRLSSIEEIFFATSPVFMRRTNFARLRRRTGTVSMWFSWVACFGHADAVGE